MKVLKLNQLIGIHLCYEIFMICSSLDPWTLPIRKKYKELLFDKQCEAKVAFVCWYILENGLFICVCTKLVHVKNIYSI